MSWDPTQRAQPDGGQGGQGQEPGQGQDPYSGYGTPQNPYGTPQPNPYDPNVQNPYATPPPQYGAPPQNPYGNPANQPGAYGYAAPVGPRPLSVAIQELPNQYIKVCTKPSAQSFAEEMGKANWGIVWIQLLGLAVIGTIFGFIGNLISPLVLSNGGSVNASGFLALSVGASIFSIISVPLSFFILVGIQYLLARAFHGQGTFLQQSYTTLLFQVPLGILRYVLGIIPILGGIAGFALTIYGLVLNIFSIMAVHRLSGGKATAVVLIPIVVVLLLFFLCILAIVAIFVAAYRSS